MPAAFAQSEGSARQVIEECVHALDSDVLGLDDIEETCPDIRVALEDLGLTDLVSDNQLSVLNRDGLESLRALVSRYENEPEREAVGTGSLAPVLDSLRKPPVVEKSPSWFERFQRWLRELLEKKQSQSDADTGSWLSRWLDEHPLPELVRWGLIYGSLALVVLLALTIVTNEVRVAVRGRHRKSALGTMSADVPGAAGFASLDLDLRGERPSALLRMLIATLVKTGRLNGAQSLTHRELTNRARFDDSTQRESFQKIAQLAEREIFSGQDVASDDLGEALRAFAETENVNTAAEPVALARPLSKNRFAVLAVLLATTALIFLAWKSRREFWPGLELGAGTPTIESERLDGPSSSSDTSDLGVHQLPSVVSGSPPAVVSVPPKPPPTKHERQGAITDQVARERAAHPAEPRPEPAVESRPKTAAFDRRFAVIR